jgi:hypothetical protein
MEGIDLTLDSNPHKHAVLEVETMQEIVGNDLRKLSRRDKKYIEYRDAKASLALLLEGLLNGSVSQEKVLERIEQIKRDLCL